MKITPNFVVELLALVAGYTFGEWMDQRRRRKDSPATVEAAPAP